MNRPFLFRGLPFILLPVLFLFAGCDLKPKPVEGTAELAAEMERQRPRRIREQELLLAAEEVGDRIVAVAQQEMDRVLPARLQAEGVAGALRYCRPEHYPSVDSLAADFGALVQRVTRRPRNPSNQAQMPASARLNELENAHATADLQEKGSLVQRFTQTDLLYTKPILIRDAYCLRCHGEPGQELAPADNLLIKDAYPGDEATGYKMRQLRGMWLITFPQREIADYITLKDLREFQARQARRREQQQN
ncbi:hypothetical protein BH24BAC1_BH24BAC1_11320 [soil metagenome]